MATRGVVPISKRSGGAELVAYQLARAAARAGHQVDLLAEVDDADFDGVPRLRFIPVESRAVGLLRRLPSMFFIWLLQHLVGNVAVALQVRRMLRAGDYDLVHTHGSLSTILISLFARAPLVYTEHDATPWSCRYRRWWERAVRKAVYRSINVVAYRRADRVATVFDALRTELIDRWSLPESKVVTIVNGVDADIFNPYSAGRRSVSSFVGFDRYALFVGRLTARKAPDLLLKALVEVEGMPCVFVGDGPMRRKLEALAESLGVAERVAFLGHVGPVDLARVYADADLLVLPSVSEGTPLVAVEAMSCGTPVLATRISGLPDVVRDWENGILVEPGDLGQLVIALGLLWSDRELAAALGRRAAADARASFLWPALAQQYGLLYEELSGDFASRIERGSQPVATLQP